MADTNKLSDVEAGLVVKLFKDFPAFTEDLDEFQISYKKYLMKELEPTNPNPNDLHPNFMNKLLSYFHYFGLIEKPSGAKAKIDEAFIEATTKFEYLNKTTNGTDEFELFNLDTVSVLTEVDNAKIVNLLPILSNKIPHDSIFTPYPNDELNGYFSLIRYLYIFLTYIDLDKPTGNDVYDFLSKNDHVYFGKYLRSIANIMQKNFKMDSVPEKTLVESMRPGVIHIINNILADIKKIPKVNKDYDFPGLEAAITALNADLSDKAKFKAQFVDVLEKIEASCSSAGGTTCKTLVDGLHGLWDNLKEYDKGVTAKGADTTTYPKRLKSYLLNARSAFVDTANVAGHTDGKGGGSDAVGGDPGAGGTGSGYGSDIMYSDPSDTTKPNKKVVSGQEGALLTALQGLGTISDLTQPQQNTLYTALSASGSTAGYDAIYAAPVYFTLSGGTGGLVEAPEFLYGMKNDTASEFSTGGGSKRPIKKGEQTLLAMLQYVAFPDGKTGEATPKEGIQSAALGKVNDVIKLITDLHKAPVKDGVMLAIADGVSKAVFEELKDVTAMNATDKAPFIPPKVKAAYKNYYEIIERIKKLKLSVSKIKKVAKSHLKDFENSFLVELKKNVKYDETSKSLKERTPDAPAAPGAPPASASTWKDTVNTLKDDVLWTLHKEVFSTYPTFWQKYIIYVDENKKPKFTRDVNGKMTDYIPNPGEIKEADRERIIVQVKKIRGFAQTGGRRSRISRYHNRNDARTYGLQKGGQDDDFGKIMLWRLVPDRYPSSIGRIWIGDVPIPRDTYAGNPRYFRNLMYQSYTNAVTGTPVTITGVPGLADSNLNPSLISSNFLSIVIGDRESIVRDRSRFLLDGTPDDDQPDEAFTEFEKEFRKFMTKEFPDGKYRWIRISDKEFVLKDQQGNDYNYYPGTRVKDSLCSFLTMNDQDCIDFLHDCVMSNEITFPNKCNALLKDPEPFSLDPNNQQATVTAVKNNIIKLPPSTAVNILKKFRFREYEAMETSPLYGPAVKDKYVESVNHWLADLHKPEVLAYFGLADPNSTAAKDFVKSIKNNKKFQLYLTVLVEWVNAHPQALAAERLLTTQAPDIKRPEADKAFDMYHHIPASSRATRKQHSVCSELGRLCGSTGGNSYALAAQTIANSPNLENPFSKAMFDLGNGYGNMVGGEPRATMADVIKAAFEEVKGRLVINMAANRIANGRSSSGQNTQLSAASDAAIKTEIENLRNLEIKLEKLVERYRALVEIANYTGGKIDAVGIPGDDIDTLLDNSKAMIRKHEYAIQRNQNRFGRKTGKLFDIIRTIEDFANGSGGNNGDSSGYRLINTGWPTNKKK